MVSSRTLGYAGLGKHARTSCTTMTGERRCLIEEDAHGPEDEPRCLMKCFFNWVLEGL